MDDEVIPVSPTFLSTSQSHKKKISVFRNKLSQVRKRSEKSIHHEPGETLSSCRISPDVSLLASKTPVANRLRGQADDQPMIRNPRTLDYGSELDGAEKEPPMRMQVESEEEIEKFEGGGEGFKFGGEIPEGAYLGFTTADGEKIDVDASPNKCLNYFADYSPKNAALLTTIEGCSQEQRRANSRGNAAKNDEEFVFGGEIPEGAYLGFTTADGEKIASEPCPNQYLDLFAALSEDDNLLLSVANESSQTARMSLLQGNPPTMGFTAANGENLYTLTEEELQRAQEWDRKLELEAVRSVNSYFDEQPRGQTGTYSTAFLERLLAQEQRKKKQGQSMSSPRRVFDHNPQPQPLSFTQEVTSAVDAVLQDTQFLLSQVGDNYSTDRDLLIAEKRRHHQSMVNNFRRSLLRSRLTSAVKRQRVELIARLRLLGGPGKAAELRKPFRSEFLEKKSQLGRAKLRDAFPWRTSATTPEPNLSYNELLDFRFNAMAFLANNDLFVEHFREGIPIGHFLVPMTETFQVGRPELELAFFAAKGIDPKLISPQWFANALKLILWKLVSMEQRLPEERREEILTVANVLNELHFRYHTEIDLSRRSFLRECLEMDAVPGQLTVLLVEEVDADNGLVRLCDGQYSVKARIDPCLQRQIERGLLRRGTKVAVDSAEFVNLDQGYAPLEVPDNVALQIHGNSTRRCRWDTRLGRFYGRTRLRVSLQSLDPSGGLVSGVDLLVVRKYPLLFVSGNEHRNERMQSVFQRNLETERRDKMERLYEEMEREVEKEEEERGKRRELPSFSSISEIEAIEDLHGVLESKRHAHLEDRLTEGRRRELAKHREKLRQERGEVIRERVNDEMSKEDSSRHSLLVRLKVTDLHSPSTEKCAELWIWNAVLDLDLDMVEGGAIYVENVVATGTRERVLQLKSGRGFGYKKLPARTGVEAIPRRWTKLSSICDISTFAPVFQEFDVVVIVLVVSSRGTEKFQRVFATDDELNLICLNFWDGLKRFSCEDLLVPGQVIALSNLQWRVRGNSHAIPNGYVTEVTGLTRNPRDPEVMGEMERLKEFLKERPLEDIKEDVTGKHAFLKNIRTDAGSLSRQNNQLSLSAIQTPVRGRERICVTGGELEGQTPQVERQVNQMAAIDPQSESTAKTPMSIRKQNKRKLSLRKL